MILTNRYFHRNFKSASICLVVVVVFAFVLIEIRHFMSSVPKVLQMINLKFSEVEEKMKYFEYMELERNSLLRHFTVLLNMTGRDSYINGEVLNYSAQMYEAVVNKSASMPIYPWNFGLPSIYVHLPHIQNDPSSMVPAFTLKSNHKRTYLTIGIPTVPRQSKSYLLVTLQSLFESLEHDERKSVLVVVLIAEPGLTEMAKETIKSIEMEFHDIIQEGLLEVIVPKKSYYPTDLNTMNGNFNDSPERTRWRTKQNLDYMYLMSHCRSRSLYYMQLEDDVVTKLNFFSNIKFFIETNSAKDWFMLQFSTLGFIGKLFHCRSLPTLIHFIALFYRDKPVDWLLFRLLHVKYCGLDMSPKQCSKEISLKVFSFDAVLFQHIGVESSLKGKIQKLKEKGFNNELKSLMKPHLNPQCTLKTSLVTYKKNTLEAAYAGKGHFWALTPVKGDHITFRFNEPLNVTGFKFKSGSPDHPNDLLNHSIAEILPVSDASLLGFTSTSDDYYMVASNDEMGVISVSLPILETIKSLRISFLQNSTNWLLLSEIWIRHTGSDEQTATVLF